ncbi:MAG: enoyl-CoA hydratase [Comamonadaceae bacterium]|nr:MAG: enoyl-CoA hydratase [Comamonadaceae bacterium]
MMNFKTVLYEEVEPGIVRISMNRPEVRNAQDLQLTYDLNAALDAAAQDDAVRVIILAATGPHFSSGHDVQAFRNDQGNSRLGKDHPVVSTWGGFSEPGAHYRFAREQEIYLQMVRRWRNLPKPTIAQVQGKCLTGGIMIAWACDLIVASDDAIFHDFTVAMGVSGVEWLMHPWELGARKAKEFLLTAEAWSAAEAHRLGMVNHVVPREALPETALSLARKIASKPLFAVKMTKEAINRSMDIAGQQNATDQAFALHQLCHAHNLQQFGQIVDPSGMNAKVRDKGTNAGLPT